MNLIEIIFLWILSASFIGTMIIILILCIQKILKNYLNPRFCHALWLLVLIKLLIPFSLESHFSWLNLFPTSYSNLSEYNGSIPFQHEYLTYLDRNLNPMKINFDLNNTQNQYTEKDSYFIENVHHLENKKNHFTRLSTKNFFTICSYIWCIGFLSIAIFLLLAFIQFNKKIRSYDKISDPQIINLLNICKKKLNIHKDISVYNGPSLKSPFIYGFFHPNIYLCKNLFNNLHDHQLIHILLHELGHYKRKDLFLNLFSTIAILFHWFNPIVWFAMKKMRVDRELACDAYVLEMLKPDESISYGFTLIQLSKIFSTHHSQKMLSTHFYQSQHELKRRIIMIKNFKKGSYKISVLALSILILLSSITLTNAQIKYSNQEFNLNTSNKHFNTLERAMDFVDFDFKVPDFITNKYTFGDISLHKDQLNISFDVANVVDTSAFRLIISKTKLLDHKISNDTSIGTYGEKISTKTILEPMIIGNIHGTRVTTQTHFEWTKEGIQKLEKNNTKNSKRIPISNFILKDFIWEDNGIWYSINYYCKDTSYYGDSSERQVSQDDMKVILSSLKYPKELQNMSYESESWKNHLYIYGSKDLKRAQNILGFIPKFPLQLPGKFTATSSNTGESCYFDTEPWSRIKTIFENKNDSTQKIEFYQTKAPYRYDFLEKNGYDRETKDKANTIYIDHMKIFVFKENLQQCYIWKKDNIIYTAKFVKTIDSTKDILKAFIHEPPYFDQNKTK
ncbi:M56 family metallopeptidase [Inediibacterium massiliense]|uniref:M56 family metallopeptidase n=1 Tax=Inediibacterium massiliense TaxID=1658111 RepID=UPI0006B450DD|nr:M56 family metallopeptidase [Inediibacterium massiliense]